MVQIRLTEEQKQQIIKDFKEGLSLKNLSIKYGRGVESIRFLLKKRGLKTPTISEGHRRFQINETFFDIIDTEEKAYFLGFLYADGYNNRTYNSVRLVLKEEDFPILNKLNSLIYPDKPLTFTKKQKKTYSNTYCLRIVNKHISQKLEQLGCGQAKTHTIRFPEFLDFHLLRHFIRGYFDGDGHVSLNHIDPYVSIVSNEDFCGRLAYWISGIVGINVNIYSSKRSNNISAINVAGIYQVGKFLDWLYNDAIIYMDRKRDRYLKIKEEINKKN